MDFGRLSANEFPLIDFTLPEDTPVFADYTVKKLYEKLGLTPKLP